MVSYTHAKSIGMREMHRFAMAVIVSLVKDIKTNDLKLSSEISETLEDEEFITLLTEAGVPPPMFDALKETLELSDIEKTYCCDQILSNLKEKVK